MRIAVLLTTYNRKQKTVACLESLKKQELPAGVYLEVYLTDDASSDGTVEAVNKTYPGANIYNGNGKLFWAGGMRNSWRKAVATNPEYYLLLNDDTTLTEKAISVLLKCCENKCNNTLRPAICIGSTVDESTGQVSYGGYRLRSKISWKTRNHKILSKNDYLDCDIANANIMLVPKEIVESIGILSDIYTHSLADYDYTLKAKKAGFDILVAPGFLGSCVDDHGNNWKSYNTSLKERIQYLKSPKGLAYKEYLTFIKDHFPLSYPSAFVKLWMKTFFPFFWDVLKKQN